MSFLQFLGRPSLVHMCTGGCIVRTVYRTCVYSPEVISRGKLLVWSYGALVCIALAHKIMYIEA
jgi:hypothetical protein